MQRLPLRTEITTACTTSHVCILVVYCSCLYITVCSASFACLCFFLVWDWMVVVVPLSLLYPLCGGGADRQGRRLSGVRAAPAGRASWHALSASVSVVVVVTIVVALVVVVGCCCGAFCACYCRGCCRRYCIGCRREYGAFCARCCRCYCRMR